MEVYTLKQSYNCHPPWKYMPLNKITTATPQWKYTPLNKVTTVTPPWNYASLKTKLQFTICGRGELE